MVDKTFTQVLSVTLWPRDFIFNPLHVCAAQHIQILTETRLSVHPPRFALRAWGLWLTRPLEQERLCRGGQVHCELLPQPWSLAPSPLCTAV